MRVHLGAWDSEPVLGGLLLPNLHLGSEASLQQRLGRPAGTKAGLSTYAQRPSSPFALAPARPEPRPAPSHKVGSSDRQEWEALYSEAIPLLGMATRPSL